MYLKPAVALTALFTAFLLTFNRQTPFFLAPEPKPVPAVSRVKISAVGDLMVHQQQLDNAYVADTDSYDFKYSFEHIRPYFDDSDIIIGNLETVFGGKDIGYLDYPCFNAPDSFGEALKYAGVNLLTTANNHSNDQGEPAVLRTIEVLDSLGIDHIGTYADEESRAKIFTKEINGINFAFISFTYGTNGIPLAKDYLVNIMSEESVKADIKKAGALDPDFIIVLPHMGNEYETTPLPVFKRWVKLMLEAGADIVLISHPHVVQPAEVITITDPDGSERTCFVAYSLGNFISSQRTPPRDEGVILHLYFERTGEAKPVLSQVSFTPTWVKKSICILPAAFSLQAVDNGADIGLSQREITRLRSAHNNILRIFLGAMAVSDDYSDEYVFKLFDK